jgi:DNA-binding NtrC family response regulator
MSTGKTVLVVEDEAMIAIELEAHLRELGHEVVLASSIDSSLQAIGAGSVDFCLLDYDLRGTPSITVAEALHAHGIPFVICSGASATQLTQTFADVPVMTKPFSDDYLDAIVARALDNLALN